MNVATVFWGGCFAATLSLVLSHTVQSPAIVQDKDYTGNLSKIRTIPDVVKAKSYVVALHPNASRKSFRGNVRVTLNLTEATDHVVLHIRNLNISRIHVKKIEGNVQSDVDLEAIVEVKDSQELHFLFQEEITEEHEVELELTFSGEINQAWRGMYYKSYYVNGNETYTILTQGDTPSIFPCVYEVNPKVNINLYLVHQSHETALSNSAVSQTDGSDYINSASIFTPLREGNSEVFAQLNVSVFSSVTVPIHAFAFAIGEFELKTKNSTYYKVTVYAPASQVNMTQHALDRSVEILGHLDTYLNRRQGSSEYKIDLVAASNVGGFSTPGLIFMSEANLFYQDDVSPPEMEQDVTFDLAYQLARLWFGNHFISKDSSEYFALDGFAAYSAQRAMISIYSLTQTEERYQKWYERIMEEDSLFTTYSPTDSKFTYLNHRNFYDPFNFQKGAVLLRMFEELGSASKVQTTLRQMLASDDHLELKETFFNRIFQGLDTSSLDSEHKKNFGHYWFHLRGYPVVTLTQQITQNRFLINGQRWNNANAGGKNWTIPLTYITSEAPNTRKLIWLYDAGSFQIPEYSTATWVKGKYDSFTLYRVNYDAEGWTSLSDALASSDTRSDISAKQRAALFNDAFALAKSGLLNYTTLLNMTRYIKNETDQSVIEEVSWGLTSIRDTIDGTIRFTGTTVLDDRETVDTYTVGLGLEVAEETQCGCKDKNKDIVDVYKTWLNNPETETPADNISDVYTFGAKRYREDWDMVFYRSTQNNQSANRLAMQTTLACTNEMPQQIRLLNYCLDTHKVDLAHLQTILERLTCHRGGRLVAFRFLKKNWDKLVEMFGGLQSPLLDPIVRTLQGFDSQFDLDELKEFFQEKTKEDGSPDTYRERAVEVVQNRLDWQANYSKTVLDWLKLNTDSCSGCSQTVAVA